MNSSTSSSKPPYLKILLTMVLGMTAAMGAIRLFALVNGIHINDVLSRVQESRAALPRITAEEKDLAMFFGSSMVQAGYSPRQFDQQMAEAGVEIKSFNFGFGGLNPYFQDFLSRRIREAFEKDNRRLKLAVIEFNPFQTTHTRRQGAVAIEDAFLPLLASRGELWEIMLADPRRGVRLFNIHYIRDGLSAELITSELADIFRAPLQRTKLKQDKADRERVRELNKEIRARFKQDYPDYSGEDWYYPWQGGGTIPEERSAETLALSEQRGDIYRKPYYMENDLLRRIQRADIIELRFDPFLVEAFIRLVKNFQQFSDHVEVVLLPKNTAWVKNTPEALTRLAQTVARIEQETGLKVRDFQDHKTITPQMFADTTHLSRYTGGVAFTSLLAATYAPLLKGEGTPRDDGTPPPD